MGRGISEDAYQAITDLSRIGQAASRWMQELAQRGTLHDPNDEYDHIRANLDAIGSRLGK